VTRKTAPPAYYLWHNFVTEMDDQRTAPPDTDIEARQYIPQDAETLALYDWLRAQETSPAGAIRAIVTRALEQFQPERCQR
jgi:hypothetical protein